VPLTGRAGQLVPAGTAPEDLRQDARRRSIEAAAYRFAPLRPINLSFTQGTRTTR
jgi:hypothetical protein